MSATSHEYHQQTARHFSSDASFSTMWAIDNFSHLTDFFKLANTLGFQKIELNHQVSPGMLSNIELDHFQFSGVHEPCPMDLSAKELAERDWVISSTNDEFRQRAVSAVQRSIQLASDLHAPVVIIHCGNVSTKMDFEVKLRSLYKSGQSKSNNYQEVKSQFVEMRKDLVRPHLAAVKRSLMELVEYAGKRNVRLGLENRYHYVDIPLVDEMQELFDLADPSCIGFVYDSGHAEALERLGFFPHGEWLSRYSGRIFGSHLHDITGLSDHLAPGLGELDFNNIAPHLPAGSFRTLEVKPGNTLAQIKYGLDVLVRSGCIKSK